MDDDNDNIIIKWPWFKVCFQRLKLELIGF